MSANVHQTSGENICSAQDKQRRDYNRRHQVSNEIEVGQKVLLKIKGCPEKVVNFYLNDLVHSQFIRYQIRTFVFLINKDRTAIKTKYNVSLLKPYLDSGEIKVV